MIQAPNSLEALATSDFEKKTYKLHKAMKFMEQHKFLEPKFSDAFNDLAMHIKQFNVSDVLIILAEISRRYSLKVHKLGCLQARRVIGKLKRLISEAETSQTKVGIESAKATDSREVAQAAKSIADPRAHEFKSPVEHQRAVERKHQKHRLPALL